MAALSTGAGAPVVYHEKSMILPDVSRVLACLYEKDVEFATVKASYKDIHTLQASRNVPVPFYDGPTFLQESRAICRYIAETYGHRGYPFLLGKDVLERASIEQWLRHEEHAFDPPSRALFCHLAFPLHDEDSDHINGEKRKLEEVLEVYEQRLGESEFLAGNKFTLADLVHLPNTHHIVTSEKFAYLYDSRKNVQRWWNTISARESWQQVVMDMKSVKEQFQMEELEKQQHHQWQTEPLPTSGGRSIRIDHRKQTGTESRTILVPPPSNGIVSTSFLSVPREEKPLPAETTSVGDQRSAMQTPYRQQHSEQAKKASADQRAAVHSPEHEAAKDAQGKTAPQDRHRGAQAITKKAREAYQKSSTSPSTRELPSGAQNAHQQSKAPPTDLKVSDLSPLQAEFEDTQDDMSGDERFSTKRLRNMFEQSEAEALKSQSTDLQAPAKEEETPSVHKKPSDVKDRIRQAGTVLAGGKTDGTSSTGTRAPGTPTSADERRATSPPKGGMAHDDRGATEPRKSPFINEQEPAPPVPRQSPTTSASASSNTTDPDDDLAQLSTIDQWRLSSTPPPIQQVNPGARGIGELAKTVGVDRRAPPSTPKQTLTDARNALAPMQRAAPSVSDEQSDKRIMDEKVQEMTQRQTPPSDTRRTSVSTQEAISGARGPTDDMIGETSGADQVAIPDDLKQTPALEAVPNVHDSSADTTKKIGVDKKAALTPPRQEPVSSSQQTTETIKEVAPTSHGITGDKSANIAMADESATPPAPLQAPASDGRGASTALQGGILDAHGENEAVKPSVVDPRGRPTTPKRPAATPDTQRRTTPDQASDQAPPLPSFADTRNEKTGLAEASQTNMVAPNGATKKPATDKKATSTPLRQEPVSSTQRTTELIKGVTPTSHGIAGNESANIATADESAAPPEPLQAPASDGASASTALQGGIIDARGENEAVKPSLADPRGMPTTPKRLAATPDTRRRTTSDQASDQTPSFPSFADTRNTKNDIAEAGQNTMRAPAEQPGGIASNNAGAPTTGPSPMKSQNNMNEVYGDGASIQQLSRDQSRVQPAENKNQGDNATQVTEISKSKEDDFTANGKQKYTGQAQETSTEGPSKLHMHSDQNKPISSKDIREQSNETIDYHRPATSTEMLPSVPEKSMIEQQLQGDKSIISQQDDAKQGTEATLPVSGTEKPRKRELLTNDGRNSGKTPGQVLHNFEEQISPDTQQVQSNRRNRKLDDSSKPTQFDSNDGNIRESQRDGSSTNP